MYHFPVCHFYNHNVCYVCSDQELNKEALFVLQSVSYRGSKPNPCVPITEHTNLDDLLSGEWAVWKKK